MKVQVYSQWREEAYIPVRVKQFTKAAKLMGHDSFEAYAAGQSMVDLSSKTSKSDERQVVANWLDSHTTDGAAEDVA